MTNSPIGKTGLEASGYLLSAVREEHFNVSAPDGKWVATVVKALSARSRASRAPQRPGCSHGS